MRALVADDFWGDVSEGYEVVILEAEGFRPVVMGELNVESPGGLADEENWPHLQVDSLVSHRLYHDGAQQVETDSSEGLGVGADPFLWQVAHPLRAEDGSLGTTDQAVILVARWAPLQIQALAWLLHKVILEPLWSCLWASNMMSSASLEL